MSSMPTHLMHKPEVHACFWTSDNVNEAAVLLDRRVYSKITFSKGVSLFEAGTLICTWFSQILSGGISIAQRGVIAVF